MASSIYVNASSVVNKMDYLRAEVKVFDPDIIGINVKKLQFIHTVNGDGSKTAKIIKRKC